MTSGEGARGAAPTASDRTYFVPFDGSTLSRTALRRARDLAASIDAEVLAFTTIPHGNASWARDRGFLEPNEPYALETVVTAAREAVESIAPETSFEHAVVGKRDVSGRIAGVIRRRAAAVDADVVFLGSANAGRVVTSLTDVGPSVAAGGAYDLYVARRADDG